MSIGGAIPSEHTQSVWEWFLPMVMPTLMLMVSVYVYAPPAHGKVDKVIYGAAFWLSVAYLLALFIPMIAHPFQPVPMIELALMSSLWLGPMQGLVASAIGVFFVKSGVAKDPGMMAHKSGS